jgi:hypothetical protein
MAMSRSLAGGPGVLSGVAPDELGDLAIEVYQAGDGLREGLPLDPQILEVAVNLVFELYCFAHGKLQDSTGFTRCQGYTEYTGGKGHGKMVLVPRAKPWQNRGKTVAKPW